MEIIVFEDLANNVKYNFHISERCGNGVENEMSLSFQSFSIHQTSA